MKGLNKGPGSYLKDIYSDIEREVLYRRVKNEKDAIMKYIISNYKVENQTSTFFYVIILVLMEMII